MSFQILNDHFTVLVEFTLTLHRLNGFVFHLPTHLLLLLCLTCHLLHQVNQCSHVGFDLAHVLIEVVDHFEGGLSLWNPEILIGLHYFLYFDDAFDLFLDLLHIICRYLISA